MLLLLHGIILLHRCFYTFWHFNPYICQHFKWKMLSPFSLLVMHAVLRWLMSLGSWHHQQSYYSDAGSIAVIDFRPGRGPIHMDDVHCNGSELTLLSCDHVPNNNCLHIEDASVECLRELKHKLCIVDGWPSPTCDWWFWIKGLAQFITLGVAGTMYSGKLRNGTYCPTHAV